MGVVRVGAARSVLSTIALKFAITNYFLHTKRILARRAPSTTTKAQITTSFRCLPSAELYAICSDRIFLIVRRRENIIVWHTYLYCVQCTLWKRNADKKFGHINLHMFKHSYVNHTLIKIKKIENFSEHVRWNLNLSRACREVQRNRKTAGKPEFSA